MPCSPLPSTVRAFRSRVVQFHIRPRASRKLYSTRPADRVLKFPSSIFQVSDEVAEAIFSGKPVVALETTIYTHGFPFPGNVRLATDLESIVRINGAIPATIGILNGVARVGLSNAELVELASAAGKAETMKVSRRDLPFIAGLGLAGKKLNGGTTIAGTMILAHMAGIEVFGTGGIGGVHRGGQDTMDVSADLTELGRTPVAVISSGPKAFLDLPRTLEFLETQGVMVGTFADGRSGAVDLPAFYTRDSGIRSPFVVHDELEAASIIYARKSLDIQSGIFMANPIPLEFSIPKTEIDSAIEEALEDAEKAGASGHANTPFILSRIKELTEGRSIPANRALIESNVRRASQVAVELAKLGQQKGKTQASTFMQQPLSKQVNQTVDLINNNRESLGMQEQPAVINKRPSTVDILVAGSVAIDLSCDYKPSDRSPTDLSPVPHTSNPAIISQSIGGVGHNVATAAHLAFPSSSRPLIRLCSIVAEDLAGKTIITDMVARGMDVSGIITLPEGRTAQYVAVNNTDKSLQAGMADMSILSEPRDFKSNWAPLVTSSFSSPISSERAKYPWLVLDANWSSEALQSWLTYARTQFPSVKVAFEPVSTAKATRLFPPLPSSTLSPPPSFPLLDLLTPNLVELSALHAAATSNDYLSLPSWWSTIDSFNLPSSGSASLQFRDIVGADLTDIGLPQMMVQLLPFCHKIIVKMGAEGVVLAKVLEADAPELFDVKERRWIVGRSIDSSIGGVYIRPYSAAPIPEEEVMSVNGAGDTFLGVVVAGLAKGMKLDEKLIEKAQEAAGITVRSKKAVGDGVGGILTDLLNGA